MKDYDEDILSEFAMRLMEYDISYQCSRYHVPGYDREDLEQECRLKLWKEIGKFDPERQILFRSWAQNIVKNHLRNLLRDALRQKRGGNLRFVPLDGNVRYVLTDNVMELEDLLDKLHEHGMNFPEF